MTLFSLMPVDPNLPRSSFHRCSIARTVIPDEGWPDRVHRLTASVRPKMLQAYATVTEHRLRSKRIHCHPSRTMVWVIDQVRWAEVASRSGIEKPR